MLASWTKISHVLFFLILVSPSLYLITSAVPSGQDSSSFMILGCHQCLEAAVHASGCAQSIPVLHHACWTSHTQIWLYAHDRCFGMRMSQCYVLLKPEAQKATLESDCFVLLHSSTLKRADVSSIVCSDQTPSVLGMKMNEWMNEYIHSSVQK